MALRIADPRLAVRISAHLEALPEVELSEEEEAEIVVADTVPARGEAMEVALIALVDGPEAVPALRAGADAVLAPDASREELRLAIEAVVRGSRSCRRTFSATLSTAAKRRPGIERRPC